MVPYRTAQTRSPLIPVLCNRTHPDPRYGCEGGSIAKDPCCSLWLSVGERRVEEGARCRGEHNASPHLTELLCTQSGPGCGEPNFYRFTRILYRGTLLPFYAQMTSLLPYPHPMSPRGVRASLTARCVSHFHIHVTYGLIPQIGKTSVADDAAQTEPGDHRRPFGGHGPSRGHPVRWV